MLTIRELGRRHGLSRATLLYYDRIGLLHPSTRSPAGYRLYDRDAEARLADICIYRNAGLALDAVARMLQSPLTTESEVLRARMHELDAEVCRLRAQQHAIAELLAHGDGRTAAAPFDKATWVDILSAAGMDDVQRQRWHRAFEANAPGAHQAFLRWLGIGEAEIAHLRVASQSAGDAEPAPSGKQT